MNVIETKLAGVLIIELKYYEDIRGGFKETFQLERYKEVGINYKFVQDNYSRSQKGVLRGLHFQVNKPQGKLISCIKGKVFDVVVDINPASSSYSQYVEIELTEDNHKQLWVPPGYAHGFCVLSDIADFQYKCTDYYYPDDQGGVIWNDSTVAIEWPINNPILSTKDQNLPKLSELKGNKNE